LKQISTSRIIVSSRLEQLLKKKRTNQVTLL